MEVIYSLIPGMTFFGLVFVGILMWAVKRGQYEDMEGNASRILLDDDEDAMLGHKASNPKAEAEPDSKM
ncbi:MAG: cbb3-type cytochrome oxidase assembly protein CcoS [Gallionella sp.]|nr:cbb3-type cytochrome oxidase assembly protein CcoS [Gallionella sp.]MDD4947614.1 cbb3-type cytochrome oxidase assembly protein CcoS [Gallionella sp.]MDD5611513.1 cbb3-type cytochrome oxidase assembly protein CcoS [Gallionella sp.]